MKKLLVLVMFFISLFAKEMPIRVEEIPDQEMNPHGNFFIKITNLQEKNITIDHAKIKINKGKCAIYDTDQILEKMNAMIFSDPKIRAQVHYDGMGVKKIVAETIVDQRFSTIEYGDDVSIATIPGCKNLLEVEIPTNLGKFVVKF